MSLTIRPYNHSTDQAAVMQLLHSNTPNYFDPSEASDLANYLAHKIEDYFVVELNTTIVAAGGVHFIDDQKTGLLAWGMVAPDHQQQKIGTALLQHRIQHIQANPHVETIRVRTSQLVYPFFQKSGFSITNVIENYWGEGIHLYTMQREVLR